jgi:hypothetical protein
VTAGPPLQGRRWSPAGYDANLAEHVAMHESSMQAGARDRGWTRHGHPITGRIQYPPEPTNRARCGALGLTEETL